MFGKLRKYLSNKEGYYIYFGINRKLTLLRVRFLRFFIPFLRKRFRKQTLLCFPDKDFLKKELTRLLGDYSGFSKTVSPTTKEGILQRAEEAILHEFDLLGSGKVQLHPINWHQDFKSGFVWPKGTFYLNYVQVDLTNDADVKVPRELSRCHHFLHLGQAYLLTGDEKYAKEFVSQTENWIEENPLMYSINWGCAMDVSIRAVNWIYALNMFTGSSAITEDFSRKILQSLWEHGFYVSNNLEKTYRNSNNHYLSDITGLLLTGMLFRKSERGRRWQQFCLLEYYREVRHQVLPSGPSYERSVNYHRLVTELAFYTFLMLGRNGINVPLDIRHRIHKMCDFTRWYIKPDGLAPVIGDQDNGRFLPFGLHANRDHSYLLTLSSIIFSDPVHKQLAMAEASDAFFMIGPDYKERFNAVPQLPEITASRVFPDAGFCILRSRDIYLFINNGGAAGYTDQTEQWGSHAHADLLSFELAVGSTSFIVDPGTYVYTSSAKERDRFRGTKMHNTVTIDGQNQHTFDGKNLFRCTQIARPLEFRAELNEDKDRFTGSHDGYTRLKEPVVHHREYVLDKSRQEIEIRDSFEGSGVHDLEWHFHFDAGIDFTISDHSVSTLSEGKNIRMDFLCNHNIVLEKVSDWISSSYGEKEPSMTLRISARETIPSGFTTRISVI